MRTINRLFFASVFCVLALSQNLSALSLWDLDPLEGRNLINKNIMAIQADTPHVYAVASKTISANGRNTPIRVYFPNDSNQLPVILLVHGGGWVGGDLDTHDNLARYLCQQTEAVVVSVGYQNSPEAKFPYALEQCYDVMLWMQNSPQDIHADLSRLAIVGDSAGGNMAAALCLMSRDRSGPKISLQVLINPGIDLTAAGPLLRHDDVMDSNRWYAAQYIEKPEDAFHPYASPGIASDLSGLPTALVILGEKDLLRGIGQDYADRLRDSGVPVNVYIQWGEGHLAGHGARVSHKARESIDVAVAALRGMK